MLENAAHHPEGRVGRRGFFPAGRRVRGHAAGLAVSGAEAEGRRRGATAPRHKGGENIKKADF